MKIENFKNIIPEWNDWIRTGYSRLPLDFVIKDIVTTQLKGSSCYVVMLENGWSFVLKYNVPGRWELELWKEGTAVAFYAERVTVDLLRNKSRFIAHTSKVLRDVLESTDD